MPKTKITILITVIILFLFTVVTACQSSPYQDKTISLSEPQPTVNADNSWLTYIDGEHKIQFQYPESLTAKYITTAVWPPKVAFLASNQLACEETPAESSLPTRVARRLVGAKEYCVSASSEGAAGSVFTEYTYTTAWQGKIISLDFTLQYPQCYNYDEPKQSECTQERESFDLDGLVDRIVNSLKLN